MNSQTAYIPLGKALYRHLRTTGGRRFVSLERQRTVGVVVGFVLMALMTMLFVAISMVCVLLRTEWFVTGFFALAALFCLGFVFSMLKAALVAGRWQPMHLELAEFPLQKGKKHRFQLEQLSKKGLIAWQSGTVSARLVCASVGITQDSRKERVSSHEYHSQWQTQDLSAGTKIQATFEFLLPDFVESSVEDKNNWIEWQLQVKVTLDQKPIPSSSFALLVE
jgi:hypothetical protein